MFVEGGCDKEGVGMIESIGKPNFDFGTIKATW